MTESPSSFLCPACQGRTPVTIGPTHGGYYQRCSDCGLDIRTISDEGSASQSFQHAQEAFYGTDSSFENPTIGLLNRQLARTRLKIIRRYLSEGRLLEIGPGTGELLRQAQAQGYDVSVVEHAPPFAEEIKKNFGVLVYCGMFEEMTLPAQTYDGIVSMQVIEHVPDPVRHLRSARAIVRPGGLLFLSTPNTDGWIRRLSRSRWPDYSEAHVHLFNPASLVSCFEQTGWNVLGVHTTQHVFDWLRAAARMARKPREVRRARHAMSVTRRTPYLLAAATINSLAFASWPLRYLQTCTGGGSELFVVGRAAPTDTA